MPLPALHCWMSDGCDQRKLAQVMLLYVACCMLHVGRLKDFMEANSRKSGLLMLFMFLEMARFPIYFIVARLTSVCAASFFLRMQSISCVHQHAQTTVHLPTDRRVLQPRRCAAALSLFCSAEAQTRHSVGVAVSALVCADCNELFHIPVPGLDLGPRTRQSNAAHHAYMCVPQLTASGCYQEELKVTDNRDATKSSYKQEMQKRVAKQVGQPAHSCRSAAYCQVP